MNTKDINNAVFEAVTARLKSLKNEDDRDWICTTYGRRVAGIAVDDELPDACPLCDSTEGIAKRRRNTAYADDEENWLVSCEECFINDFYAFQEQWDDYYSSVL